MGNVLIEICQSKIDSLFEDHNKIWSSLDCSRSELERVLKRKTLGNMHLIANMHKKNILPLKLMIQIINELFGKDPMKLPPENFLEALCELFKVAGKHMCENAKNPDSIILSGFLSRLLDIKNNQKLSSRLRFLIHDVIDLHANGWYPRRNVMSLNKLKEVQVESLGLYNDSYCKHKNVAKVYSLLPACALTAVACSLKGDDKLPVLIGRVETVYIPWSIKKSSNLRENHLKMLISMLLEEHCARTRLYLKFKQEKLYLRTFLTYILLRHHLKTFKNSKIKPTLGDALVIITTLLKDKIANKQDFREGFLSFYEILTDLITNYKSNATIGINFQSIYDYFLK